VFPSAVWDGLQALDTPTFGWLLNRLPGLKIENIRSLPLEATRALMDDAVARGYSGTDLFSDGGLRSPISFLIRQDVLATIFEEYEVRVLNLATGMTLDGRRYDMQAMLLGNGRVEILYNLNDFEFENPYYPGTKYTFKNRLTYTIRGPGDLGVKGASLDHGIIKPTIERFVKVGPDKVRVETNWGARTKPLEPLLKRPKQ
jgi:hypothetical protein